MYKKIAPAHPSDVRGDDGAGATPRREVNSAQAVVAVEQPDVVLDGADGHDLQYHGYDGQDVPHGEVCVDTLGSGLLVECPADDGYQRYGEHQGEHHHVALGLEIAVEEYCDHEKEQNGTDGDIDAGVLDGVEDIVDAEGRIVGKTDHFAERHDHEDGERDEGQKDVKRLKTLDLHG